MVRTEKNAGETQNLAAKSVAVKTKIDGAFARTTLTTIYKNPNTRRIEADFLYSAPKNSVVTGFAYWFGEEKVVARVAEKRRAARIYSYITTRQRDPALIEMVGKNAFRARIFPVEANQDLKIEIQLAQKLDATPTGLRWNYPIAEETKTPLENFSASVESSLPATSNFGAFANGKLILKRENYQSKGDLQVEIARNRAPLRASLLARRESATGDGFFALQLVSNAPIVAPRLKIAGVETFDVLVPKIAKLEAGAPFVVVGRYRKTGKAVVALNNQSVSLDFGATTEQNNAAASLWAQARIESLSNSEKNRFEVVKLSSRFGIVSKWTSWLAIPREERKRFDQEILQADLYNAGRAYAQAIGRGDRKTAQSQKTIWQGLNSKLGGQNSLDYALNVELEAVSSAIDGAKYAKTSRAQLALWKKTQRTLVKAGARRDRDEYAVGRRALEEASQLAPLYVAELEAGRGRFATARRLKKRLLALSNLRAVRRNYSQDLFGEQVNSASYERGVEISYRLAKERAETRLSAARERDLKSRLARLPAIEGAKSSGERQLLEEKVRPTFQTLVAGVGKGESASDATRRFEELWTKWQTAAGVKSVYNGDFYRQLSEASANRLAAQIKLKRENEPENVELARDFEVLQKKSGDSYNWNLRRAWSERAQQTADELLKIQLELGKDAPRADELAKELARLSQNSQAESQNFVGTAAAKEREDAKGKLIPHVLAKTENGSEAQKINARLEKLYALDARFQSDGYGDRYYLDWELTSAWKGRAHEVAYQILDAQQKAPAQVPALKNELERLALKANNKPDQFLAWEKARRDRGEKILTPTDYYRLRPGDPLISVLAPANCQKVVAILPDGQILSLAFDATKKAWETRFDVPTWAASGDYAVKILVVAANGNRQQLTMHFAVDSLAPTGKASLENNVLRVESDEHTDRVSAFLPSGERVELRRGENGVFQNSVALPANFSLQNGAVRFVLTDKAHNRTEIRVEK